jgi:hypothetical protein
MEVTTTKHISKLDVAQPSGSSPISEADDHLRFIKDCIKTTFSGITSVGSGNVTADAAALNKLDGYTGTTGDLNTIAGAVSSGLTVSDIAKLAGVSATSAQLNNTANIPANTNTALGAKANLASPTLTGTPKAPTQAASDNSTKIATTAYVTAKTSGIPTSSNLAATNAAVALNTDYRASSTLAIAGKANINSPALTGNPTATTQAATDNSTKIATTAFVTGALGAKANLASPALTGTPTAPTAGAAVNTTQIATTAFVQGLLGGYPTTATFNAGITSATTPSASVSTAGKIEIATTSEAAAGTSADKALTPSNLLGVAVDNQFINSVNKQGSVTIAGVGIKWGIGTSTTGNSESFTYDTAFPNFTSVVMLTRDTNAGVSSLNVNSRNKSGFTIDRDNNTYGAGNYDFYFLAIGG